MSKTKEKILDISLALFNEKGTRIITTNHIAEACEISPGNLYYHYKNKEEIIFSLFGRMISGWDLSNKNPHILQKMQEQFTGADIEVLLDSQLEKTFQFVWQYRFIHRELAELLDRNEALKKLCNQVLQRRLLEVEVMIQFLIDSKILRPLEKRRLNLFLTRHFILVYFGSRI